jgi:hypothetical protein
MTKGCLCQVLAVACAIVASATSSFAGTRQPAFPPSFETARVIAADTCWRDCQSTCTWGLPRCVRATPQGLCLKFTDRCDRACLISCRQSGGPLVPIK